MRLLAITINWATPLYILALYGLIRFAIRDPEGATSKKTVNWSPLESVGVTLFIYFFGQLLGGLILALPLSLAGWSSDRITDWISNNTFGQFLAVSLIEAITVGLLVIFLRRRKTEPEDIGVKGRPELSDLGKAILAYVVYFGIFLIVSQVAKTIFPNLNLDQKQDIGFNQVAQAQLPLVFISLVVLPPIVEELLMRGFLYTGLKQTLPRITAIFLTSFLFAIAHLEAGSAAPLLWVAAIDTFILSTVLIYLRDKTGKLWASMMLHAIKNGIAFVLLFVLAR
jgi:membrane protease YdiL (CAAX protease family)